MNTKLASYSVMPISNTRRNLVRFYARRGAHRGYRPAWRHQRDAVAGMQRQQIGEPAADGDALAFVKTLERALLDVFGDRGEVVEIVGANTANQHAGGIERRGRQRLAIHHGRGEPDARDQVDGGRRRPSSRSAAIPAACTSRCPLRPRILSKSSLRKPFMTAITMISVATPSMMPRNEKPAITEMKPSLRRARK